MIKPYLRRYVCSLCISYRSLFHTLSRADNAALLLQHSTDTVGTGQCFGNRNDQVCHLDQLYQNLGHVIYKRYRLPLGDDAGIYLFSGDPHHCDDRKVHYHVSHWVHQGRDLANKNLELHQKAVGFIEIPDLILLTVEGTDNTRTG